MRWFNFKRKSEHQTTEKQSAVIITGAGYTGAVAPDTGYDKLSRESYMKNVVAFRCIDLISKAVASVNWKIMQRASDGTETILQNHPLAPLLKRPNPREGFAALIERMMAYYMIGGNAYLEGVRVSGGMRGGTVRELYVHQPDRITIQRNGLEVTGYKYEYDSIKYEWKVDPLTGKCDLLHLKTFHPLDDFYGWGITMSAAGELDSSNDANEWNRTSFKNGCRPGMIMSFSRRMTPEQYEAVKKQLQSYTGSENAGKTLILQGMDETKGEVTITPYGWNPQEMDFTESENKMARRIAFAYGVPPQMVGIPGDTTYANYKEARESFWEDTISWYLQLLQTELNNWLLPDENVYMKPMLDESPAMEAKKAQNLAMAQASDFLTINEKRTLAGFAPIDGGDVMLVGMGMTPLLGDDAVTEEAIADEEARAQRELMRIVGDEKVATALMQGDYND
jgi:HK97 family phage portal protein